jgi:hypothetical protein
MGELGFNVVLVDTNWANVQAAKMESLAAHYRSILADNAIEALGLGGIGRLLAFTANDEVNTLATQHFTHLFGRASVYQLATSNRDSRYKEAAPQHLRGRTLFAADATHTALHARMRDGAVIKATRLTPEFDAAAYRELYGASAIFLFIVSASGKLAICTPDTPIAPNSGDTLVAMVEPRREAKD